MKKNKKISELTSTSKFLAREIVHYIGKNNSPISILEVCPTNAKITEAILEKMDVSDSLTIYLMNDNCQKNFKKLFIKDKRIKVVYQNIRNLLSEKKFDYIIMDLPINTFDPPIVAEMMNKLIRSLTSDGILTYYEYIKIDQLKRKILAPSKRKKSLILKQLIISLLKNYEFKREKVFLNFPPLYVHYLHNRD
jgi:phospholipid N-methyltransferase